jgi:undecaprenyl-phosphate 4-deoxy-4-formamido-L-arabinose transferase
MDLRKESALETGISVVIPVFQTTSTLVELVSRIKATLHSNFEIILVDDGCPAHIWEEIVRLGSDQVRGIRLYRNSGQHAAVLAGVRAARFSTTVTMDDDLQNPPEEIPKLIAGLQSTVDVVYGRGPRMSHSLMRRALSATGLRLISRFSHTVTPFHMTSFRAFRTEVRSAFDGYTGPETSFDALLSWVATEYVIVETEHAPRLVGKSNYTFRKLAEVFVREFITYSTFPLRVATSIGLILVALSVGALGYVIAITLISDDDVPGFGFLASFLSIIVGSQMIFLGLIGQYVEQIHNRVMRKPAYVIAERTYQD